MESRTFEGYPRSDGRVGVRNRVGVIYTVDCARIISEQIAMRAKNAVSFGWFNCYSMAKDEDTNVLIGLGKNPNVGAAIVVGLGSETISPSTIADGIAKSGKEVKTITIQAAGGTKKTIERGTSLAKKMGDHISKIKRKPFDLSFLTLGLKCGGSDATSALTANPILGLVADRIVKAGGRVMSSELTELTGCEHLVAERAKDPVLAQQAR